MSAKKIKATYTHGACLTVIVVRVYVDTQSILQVFDICEALVGTLQC